MNYTNDNKSLVIGATKTNSNLSVYERTNQNLDVYERTYVSQYGTISPNIREIKNPNLREIINPNQNDRLDIFINGKIEVFINNQEVKPYNPDIMVGIMSQYELSRQTIIDPLSGRTRNIKVLKIEPYTAEDRTSVGRNYQVETKFVVEYIFIN